MQKCPTCGKVHTAGSGKARKSKPPRQFKKFNECSDPADWLDHLWKAAGGKDEFFAAIRHEIGSRPFPLDKNHPTYAGFNLNDVPDEFYLKECFDESKIGFHSMTGKNHGGKTDLWYYALAVKKENPLHFAKKHSLTLAFPPRECPKCGKPGYTKR